MAAQRWGLHWFRRDLRIVGNAALSENWKENDGRVLGFFCFDPAFLSRPDFSIDRFAFFLKTLEALRTDLRKAGGDLLVLDEGPQNAFPALLEKLSAKGGAPPSLVTWCRDYEPFARERDSRAEAFFASRSIETRSRRDHLLFEPPEIVNASAKDKSFYSVYSPFARRWFEALRADLGRSRIEAQKKALRRAEERQRGVGETVLFRMRISDLFSPSERPADALDAYLAKILKQSRVPIPQAGHAAALKAVEAFRAKIDTYDKDRDFPAQDGTSRLSIYLKNGSICSSQVIAALELQENDFRHKTGPANFVREIAWREFYYHVLWHRPDVEGQAFLPQYRGLKWENDERLFDAWTQGRTGYPIVDAGMRELAATGWMHNRVRMIVASFLTKDLLIDWKQGERWFMERLLDGDLAPNNGGWQWAASTGCDPQPYFRIFNPDLQSKKFDPDGDYIRRYVPELARVSNSSRLHSRESLHLESGYPEPIVEHSVRRNQALALYRRE